MSKKTDVEIEKLSILLLGNSFVGKTSISRKYTTGNFQNFMMNTVGVDFTCKTMTYQNKQYCLKIWDTAGQERFQHISRGLVRKADGLIFVYDITKNDTFQDLIDCFKVCQEENNLSNIGSILVGNKADLESDREVSENQGMRKAKELGLKFLEVSALTGQNIDEAFELVVSEILRRRLKEYVES